MLNFVNDTGALTASAVVNKSWQLYDPYLLFSSTPSTFLRGLEVLNSYLVTNILWMMHILQST